MAVYRCEECGLFVDDDYHPMTEEGLCPNCEERRESEEEENVLD